MVLVKPSATSVFFDQVCNHFTLRLNRHILAYPGQDFVKFIP